MKKSLTIIKVFFATFLFVFIFELITRVILFIPTNSDVFKYGFKKSVIFDIVDLSKLQITIVDKDRRLRPFKNNEKQKIWIFGGSTTNGYNCEGNQSSSWPDQLKILDNKFNFINFAFDGANTDQQITLFWKSIIESQPEIIFWASKFNTSNIIGQNKYRNKELLNYEFSNIKKTKFLTNIKRVDKTLKKYFIFYSLLDEIIARFNYIFDNQLMTQSLTSNPTKKDIFFSLKNFELNTIEAIEASKRYGVKEFYLVSLFDKNDISQIKKKEEKLYLYENIIKKIEKKYFPFVKIIDDIPKLNKDESNKYFCDEAHKTLMGQVIQANLIYKKLILQSKVFK